MVAIARWVKFTPEEHAAHGKKVMAGQKAAKKKAKAS
jgi:hypothetical protein